MQFKQITKKEVYPYKGKVYDLTVKDVHSYSVDNLVVHNSGAGSLVNYALGITQVNPLDYDLIFERKMRLRSLKWINCGKPLRAKTATT